MEVSDTASHQQIIIEASDTALFGIVFWLHAFIGSRFLEKLICGELYCCGHLLFGDLESQVECPPPSLSYIGVTTPKYL
jgi:hypothetical protein